MFVLEMHHYQYTIFFKEQYMFVECNLLGCQIV